MNSNCSLEGLAILKFYYYGKFILFYLRAEIELESGKTIESSIKRRLADESTIELIFPDDAP